MEYDSNYQQVDDYTPYVRSMTNYYPSKEIIEDGMTAYIEVASQPSGYRFE